MEEFKDRLIQSRKAKNLSQKEVAKILNITRSCYANYEQGTRKPEIDLIKKICILFDITSDYLIGLEDEIKNKNTYINNSFNINSFNNKK